MHTDVCSSTTHNCEARKQPRWVDKENGMECFSDVTKKWNYVLFRKMERTADYHMKQYKPDLENRYGFFYMRNLKFNKETHTHTHTHEIRQKTRG